MGFHDVRFPDDIAYGSQGGPGFNTNVIVTDSGAEERIARWSEARHRYDVSYGIRTLSQVNILKEFYMARQGVANAFRYKDFADFTTGTTGTGAHTNLDVLIGVGDGSNKNFQLIKIYESGGFLRNRTITYPVVGTVLVTEDGVSQTLGEDFTVNSTTGVVSFTVAPVNLKDVKAGFEFDVPVRFGEEVDASLQMTYDSFESGSISSIPLIEVINEEPVDDEFYFGGAATPIALDADITLTQINGRVQRLDPTGSGKKVFLPDETNLKLGGPYFYMQNADTTDSFALRTFADVAVATIAKSPDAGSRVVVVLGLNASSVKTWYVF
jgi:uncharacterized protein (TIGR02217 family)